MRTRRIRVLFASVLLGGGASVLFAGPPAYAAPPGCTAGAAADFNGDGRADAAVADPSATVAGQAAAGRVLVLYGDADGRVGDGSRGALSQGSDSVGGVAEAGDRFGSALATADVDCDGFTDLLVGTPYEDINGQADSGYVQLIWGTSTGLGTGVDDSIQYTQIDFSRPIGAGDEFGYAVDVVEDAGQDGAAAPDAYAMAIGAPGAKVGNDEDAGFVGVTVPGGEFEYPLTQDSPTVPGEAEAGDRFGESVALNYLTGVTDLVDIAAGAPREDKGSIVDAGNVTIISDLGPDAYGTSVIYDQDSPGVANAPETGDRFGFSLDSIRTGSTTRLAVGVPYEDVGAAGSAGLVQLFGGNGSSLSPGPGLTQNTAGVLDSAETGDLFGDKVAYAPSVAADPVVRLAVATPGEDGIATNTGLVQLFPLNDIDAETSYSQSSPGVPGSAQAGDKFGAALAVVTGPTERVLLVGVPDDVEYSSGMVNVIPIDGGAQRTLVPGSGGIPAAGANRFGAALAGAGNPNG